MHPKQTPLILAIFAFLALTGPAAHAQRQPPPIDNLARVSQPFTEQQRETVRNYIEYWVERLQADDPINIGQAREKLKSPLNAFNVTFNFRHVYTSELIPVIRPVILNEEMHLPAMNAMQIVARLETKEALAVMVDRCDLGATGRGEQRAAIRIWAARGVREILKAADLDEVDAGSRTTATRALGRAVQNETDWRVVRRQLDAISNSSNAATTQVLDGSVGSVIGKMRNNPRFAWMMGALRPTTVGHRTRFLDPNLGPAEKRSLGRTIAQRIGEILDVVDQLWEAAAKDPQLRREFSRTVEVAEKLLNLIDLDMGGTIGESTLQEAFDSRERETYQAELIRIKQALARPPYK